MDYRSRLYKAFGWINIDRKIKSTTSSNNLSDLTLLDIYSDEVAEVYNFYKSKYNLSRDLDDIIVSIEVGESNESYVAFWVHPGYDPTTNEDLYKLYIDPSEVRRQFNGRRGKYFDSLEKFVRLGAMHECLHVVTDTLGNGDELVGGHSRFWVDNFIPHKLLYTDEPYIQSGLNAMFGKMLCKDPQGDWDDDLRYDFNTRIQSLIPEVSKYFMDEIGALVVECSFSKIPVFKIVPTDCTKLFYFNAGDRIKFAYDDSYYNMVLDESIKFLKSGSTFRKVLSGFN